MCCYHGTHIIRFGVVLQFPTEIDTQSKVLTPRPDNIESPCLSDDVPTPYIANPSFFLAVIAAPYNDVIRTVVASAVNIIAEAIITVTIQPT